MTMNNTRLRKPLPTQCTFSVGNVALPTLPIKAAKSHPRVLMAEEKEFSGHKMVLFVLKVDGDTLIVFGSRVGPWERERDHWLVEIRIRGCWRALTVVFPTNNDEYR